MTTLTAAQFDAAFHSKDEATLKAYAADILAAVNNDDLTIEIQFGTDPYSEYPDFINSPNGFSVMRDGETVIDIYTPTEKCLEADNSEFFTIYCHVTECDEELDVSPEDDTQNLAALIIENV